MIMNKEAQEQLLKIFNLFKERIANDITYSNELIRIRKDYLDEINKIML